MRGISADPSQGTVRREERNEVEVRLRCVKNFTIRRSDDTEWARKKREEKGEVLGDSCPLTTWLE